MANDCIFCAIAAGRIPADVVHQDDAVVVFRDIDPKAPVHLLAIPRRHIPATDALEVGDEELIGRVILAAKEAARAAGVADGGYRLVVNNGPDAGQSVSHLHVHILGGRALGWPPG